MVIDSKGSIEVAESQETSYVFDGFWGGPLHDALDFDRVHLDFSMANDDA